MLAGAHEKGKRLSENHIIAMQKVCFLSCRYNKAQHENC